MVDYVSDLRNFVLGVKVTSRCGSECVEQRIGWVTKQKQVIDSRFLDNRTSSQVF